MRVLAFLCLCLSLLPLPLAGQTEEEDRGFLTALLEENLSGEGTTVTITGFAGALSSVASISALTIADEAGVWISFRDVTLDWNRAALLSGRVEVNALTAQEIVLSRLPQAGASAGFATGGAAFALPTLPVSVAIGRIEARRIVIAAQVLGQEVIGSASASASLGGGEGQVNLTLRRQGEGRLDLAAGYANATGDLSLSLIAEEAAGGVAASLLRLPGAPSVRLEIAGSGPLNDFAADVSLATDGVSRLAGKVTLLGGDAGGQTLSAALAGDLAPLFQPQYRPFLGSSAALFLAGTRFADGRIELTDLTLDTGALSAGGQISLAPDGLPERFDLTAAITAPAGGEVLLPLAGGAPTRLRAARLTLGFDAARGEAWRIAGDVEGLSRGGFSARALSLTGGGTIERRPEGNLISAEIVFDGSGLESPSAALGTALGPAASGRLVASWQAGSGRTEVTTLELDGAGYALSATGAIGGLAGGFALDGQLRGRWDDLAALSGLAGLPLRGSAEIALAGSTSLLGDAFDLALDAQAVDLALGQAQLDAMLAGDSSLRGQVRRDEAGTVLRDVVLAAGPLSATLDGRLNRQGARVDADLALTDLSRIGERFSGALRGRASYDGTLSDGVLALTGGASGLGIGQPEIDRVIAGETNVTASLALTKGALRLQSAQIKGQALDLSLRADGGEGRFDLTASLADLALVLPRFPGPLTASGPVLRTGAGYELDIALSGPAQVAGKLTGTLDADLRRADLAFSGASLADVLNPLLKPRLLSGRASYDLTLKGPLERDSIGGTVTLAEGRLADPDRTFGLQGITARMDLSAGRASFSGAAEVSTGGSVSVTGNAEARLPFQGALDIRLTGVTLREPRLYEVRLGGTLQMQGPLAGGATISGALDLEEAELRIPSSGFSGAEPIPDIRHLAEPAAVRATRLRAGLIGEPTAARSRAAGIHALDIELRASNRIFLRGRGIDSEIGGSLRLRGTTASIRPEGAFELIRGRLDLVGRRLILSQAQIALFGEFIPTIDILASIEDSDILSTIRIWGPANAPLLAFSSSPPLPDEEVLAQLLFGKSLTSLSAFQAVQLATAVSTLAGRGGEGLVGRIRQSTGLNNLDIQTAETGETSLTAGKYLSDNIYSEVTIDQTGQSRIEINLDVRPHVTVRGSLESDGNTGVGVFVEKNY